MTEASAPTGTSGRCCRLIWTDTEWDRLELGVRAVRREVEQEDLVNSVLVDRDERAYEAALASIADPNQRHTLIDTVADAVDAANNGTADIVLLAARRMTCIYALLRESGMKAPERGTIVSDRFIELMSPGAWAGKTVRLLDDTTVTGRTLEERAAIASRLVGDPALVDSRAAVDLTGVNDDQSFGLHQQFAMAFGEGLVPFFTDFPVSAETTVDVLSFDNLLASRDWRAIDVTNAVIAGSGARAYSLFPNAEMIASFQDSLGESAALVEIVKLRVYAFDDGPNVKVRIVPLVLTKSLTSDSLTAWLKSVSIEASGNGEQITQALGIVSFMLSRQFLTEFAARVNEQLGIDFVEDVDFAQLTLGSELDSIAGSDSLPTLEILRTTEDAPTREAIQPVFTWPNGDESHNHYAILGDDVVIPGFECLKSTQAKMGGRRDPGWEKDATTLMTIASAGDMNLLTASLAIDVLNDLGYAVPAPLAHDGQVFRGYRAGEAALRPIDSFPAGPLGGKLAAFPETMQISDERYFEDFTRLDDEDDERR